MATVTLSTLRTRVRQRTDTENSGFVTDAELNQLINTSYAELYGELARCALNRSETAYTVPITGASSYALPADFLGLIGVYRTVGEDKLPLARFADKFRQGTRTGDATEYRVVGANIVLYPVPSAGTYELVYIPQPTALSLDVDTLNGVNGWEEFVVIDVAINVLAKEESDTTHLERRLERIRDRIRAEAQLQEFTDTPRILNVNEPWRQLRDPAGWFGGSDLDWDF